MALESVDCVAEAIPDMPLSSHYLLRPDAEWVDSFDNAAWARTHQQHTAHSGLSTAMDTNLKATCWRSAHHASLGVTTARFGDSNRPCQAGCVPSRKSNKYYVAVHTVTQLRSVERLEKRGSNTPQMLQVLMLPCNALDSTQDTHHMHTCAQPGQCPEWLHTRASPGSC
jgi:hypothetical protein